MKPWETPKPAPRVLVEPEGRGDRSIRRRRRLDARRAERAFNRRQTRVNITNRIWPAEHFDGPTPEVVGPRRPVEPMKLGDRLHVYSRQCHGSPVLTPRQRRRAKHKGNRYWMEKS